MPHLARIVLFPVKSLDGVEIQSARILSSGGLEYDRRFALADGFGKIINGKRNPAVHGLRAQFDAGNRFDAQRSAVTLQAPGRARRSFHFGQDRSALADWLSDYFGSPVQVLENPGGFPDDTEASGPTIASEATTHEVASWFPGLRSEDVHRRFRANLELSGVPAFWEDQLFAEPGAVVDFTVGDVQFEGSNPCARCVVPTRDPMTAAVSADFQKLFIGRRKASLPSWAPVSRFDHYYRLCVNTRIPSSQAGKTLNVGDEVKLLGTRRIE